MVISEKSPWGRNRRDPPTPRWGPCWCLLQGGHRWPAARSSSGLTHHMDFLFSDVPDIYIFLLQVQRQLASTGFLLRTIPRDSICFELYFEKKRKLDPGFGWEEG